MRLIKLHNYLQDSQGMGYPNSEYPIPMYINPEHIEAMWTYRAGNENYTLISMVSRDSHIVKESMDEVYKLIFPDRAIPLPDPANTNTVYMPDLFV